MFFKRKIEREIEETERNLKMSFETTMLPGRIDFFSSTGELRILVQFRKNFDIFTHSIT